MKVFILEDDELQRQKLKNVVCSIFFEKQLTCKKIIANSDYRKILENIDEPSCKNIYFLDIEIDENDKQGLEVAKLIRKKDKLGSIIFITTHSEFIPVTFSYKVSALDFIDKGLEEDKFNQRIMECIQEVEETSLVENTGDLFILNNQHANFQVPFSEILYFETTEVAHKLKLITKNRVISFYGDMKTIEVMDERFIRTHRSYIVNRLNVVCVNKKEIEVELLYKEKVMISRRMLKATLALLQ